MHRIKKIEAIDNDVIGAVSDTIAYPFCDSDKMDDISIEGNGNGLIEGLVGTDDYSLYASENSDDDYSLKFRKPAVSNEPLCVGDTVEYINPIFVRNPEHVQISFVQRVKDTPAPNKDSDDREEMYSVCLACEMHLQNTERIRRIGIANFSEDGAMTSTKQPNGVWRPIHKFRLIPGDLGSGMFGQATAKYRMQQAFTSAQEYLKDNNVPADMIQNVLVPSRRK